MNTIKFQVVCTKLDILSLKNVIALLLNGQPKKELAIIDSLSVQCLAVSGCLVFICS